MPVRVQPGGAGLERSSEAGVPASAPGLVSTLPAGGRGRAAAGPPGRRCRAAGRRRRCRRRSARSRARPRAARSPRARPGGRRRSSASPARSRAVTRRGEGRVGGACWWRPSRRGRRSSSVETVVAAPVANALAKPHTIVSSTDDRRPCARRWRSRPARPRRPSRRRSRGRGRAGPSAASQVTSTRSRWPPRSTARPRRRGRARARTRARSVTDAPPSICSAGAGAAVEPQLAWRCSRGPAGAASAPCRSAAAAWRRRPAPTTRTGRPAASVNAPSSDSRPSRIVSRSASVRAAANASPGGVLGDAAVGAGRRRSTSRRQPARRARR